MWNDDKMYTKTVEATKIRPIMELWRNFVFLATVNSVEMMSMSHYFSFDVAMKLIQSTELTLSLVFIGFMDIFSINYSTFKSVVPISYVKVETGLLENTT